MKCPWRTCIGVTALADKYEVQGLGECAAKHMATQISDRYFDMHGEMVEAHYKQCIVPESVLGMQMCDIIAESEVQFALRPDCRTLAKKYPNFAVDLFTTYQRRGGRLTK
jgi:hypothetical protein